MNLVPLEAGSPILVAGPTNSGKTFWVKKLLASNMFSQPVHSVLYCYGIYQSFFNTMKSDITCPMVFHEGLPSKETLDKFMDNEDEEEKKFRVIVLDDLMKQIIHNSEMEQLFTQGCHHKNISAIFIVQNVFPKGTYARTISLNCHIFVLFANKRDESQIHTLARQLFPKPTKWKRFLNVYEEVTEYPFSYIVIDCTPSHPRSLKVRSHIFPGEVMFVYDI
jgi:hypothetical protein